MQGAFIQAAVAQMMQIGAKLRCKHHGIVAHHNRTGANEPLFFQQQQITQIIFSVVIYEYQIKRLAEFPFNNLPGLAAYHLNVLLQAGELNDPARNGCGIRINFQRQNFCLWVEVVRHANGRIAKICS